MQKLIISVRAFIVFAILFGLIYPFFIMGVSHIIFPYQANGSLLKVNNKIIGSALIAQEFTSPKYFHSRFSFVDYNAANSGGSNLAPSNKKLIDQTKDRINHIRTENHLPKNLQLPADMLLDSYSGLDPHISLQNALLQLPRVAKYRGISEYKIKRMIYANSNSDFIGIWGEKEVVNVLTLNLALDGYINGTHRSNKRWL